MKKILIPCVFTFLAMAAPAMAADMHGPLANAVGQPVYDTSDMKVGVIRGETSETGEPSAIVDMTDAAGSGNHNVLIAEENLQPRGEGGWLASLDSNSIAQLRPYVPGRMPPA